MGYALEEIRRPAPPDVRRPGDGAAAEYATFWETLGARRVRGGRVQPHRQGRPRGVDAGDLQPDPRRRGPARSRWSSSPSTSRRPSCATPSSRARTTRSTAPRRSSSSTSRATSCRERELPAHHGLPPREIVGQHHCMFCDRRLHRPPRSTATSGMRLRKGEIPHRPLPPHRQVRPRRLDPGHLQPDPRPRTATPFKVVKYAYDITDQVRAGAAARRQDPGHERRRSPS